MLESGRSSRETNRKKEKEKGIDICMCSEGCRGRREALSIVLLGVSRRVGDGTTLRDTDNRRVNRRFDGYPRSHHFGRKGRYERKAPFTDAVRELSARNGGGVVTGPCRGPHAGLYPTLLQKSRSETPRCRKSSAPDRLPLDDRSLST